MVTVTCTQNYTRNQNNAGWQLNAVPIRTVNNAFEIYFPRPWLIVGLVDLSFISITSPTYQYSNVVPMAPADQDTYKAMFQAIFLDLAFATCYPKDFGYAVEYIDKGIQAVDYRGKFVKFLSDESLNTREQIYNSIIMPESIIQQFMLNASALTPIDWDDKHREVVNFLKSTTDQELFGAPGLYRISESGTAIPEWNVNSSYETFIPE